jgi:hypothetical protein
MTERLVIVARSDTVTYECLRQRFSDDRTVQVILDRRIVVDRRWKRGWIGPERRRANRRVHVEIDREVQARGRATFVRAEATTPGASSLSQN